MNTKRCARWCVLAAAMLQAGVAQATHPDYEGERGFELELMPGFAGALTHDESVFLPSNELPRSETRPPSDAFGAGFGFNAAVGWRFAPFVSAGLTGGFALHSPANEYAPVEAAYEPRDTIRSFHVGAYARVYPMAFFNGSRHDPRVFFDTWLDRRRFDPWLSLGVDFAQYSRNRAYDAVGSMDSYTNWTTRYIGVPIGIGLEYRVITRLAVGLTATFTPLVGADTTKERLLHVVTPGMDVTTREQGSYAPASGSNTSFFVGLGLRYTFTY